MRWEDVCFTLYGLTIVSVVLVRLYWPRRPSNRRHGAANGEDRL
jgi:hypothetical protein